MMRILHLFDSSAGWEQRVAVSQLLSRLPASDYGQDVTAIDRQVVDRLRFDGVSTTLARRRLWLPALAGPAIRAQCARDAVDVVHAWGVDAAAAARAALPADKPLAVTIYDPGLDQRGVRVLRAVTQNARVAVVCSAERVQRRLVEQGVPAEAGVLLRPAVEFAAIEAVDREGLRAELNLPPEAMVALTPEADHARFGQFAALWSIMMRWYLDAKVRVIVPGVSPEHERLRRLVAQSEPAEVGVFPGNRYRFEELCRVANYLVLGAAGDVSTTAIGWAMAASVPVIAPATYATTELLSADLNGILFQAPDSPARTGAAICALYDKTDNLARIKEVARGQAYEILGLSRAVRQHRQLYENLLGGVAPGTDITDPAVM